MRINQRKRKALIFVLSGTAVIAARQAVGAVWSGVPGTFYSTTAYWTPYGPPTGGEAQITNQVGFTANTPCNLDFNYNGTTAVLYDIVVEANQNGYVSDTSSVTLQENNTSDSMYAGSETVGGYSGQGIYNQSTASNTTNYLSIGGSHFGQYNLAGGTLSVSGTEILGFTGLSGGAFYQTAGTHTLTNTSSGSGLVIGGNNFGGTGTYTLIGGSLQTVNTYIAYGDGSSASIGTFNQTGGTYNTSLLSMGVNASSTGRFYISGGTAQIGTGCLGGAGSGTITATGGNFNIGSSSAGGRLWVGEGAGGGTINLQAGTSTTPTMHAYGDVDLGIGSTGTVLQSAGSMAVDGVLHVGYQAGSSGVYNMSGGTLTAGYVADGLGGNGTIILSGGTQTIQGLLMGEENGSTGTLNISGTAALSCTPEEDIAFNGNATVNQQGGSNLTPTLYLGGAVFGGRPRCRESITCPEER